MPLTKDFRETVQARAACDPAFREAMFQEAMQSLLQGDADGGRAALRAYINATLGFERLGAALGRPQKSLMRMFGPNGNPTAENLLGVIGVLQTETGVHLEIRAVAGRGLDLGSRYVRPRREVRKPASSDYAVQLTTSNPGTRSNSR